MGVDEADLFWRDEAHMGLPPKRRGAEPVPLIGSTEGGGTQVAGKRSLMTGVFSLGVDKDLVSTIEGHAFSLFSLALLYSWG